MGETLDVGVVGVGAMGRHHARVYNELSGATLIGVADANADRAKQIADENGVRACDSAELCKQADAVSIAVPTRYHAEVARQCIDAGTGMLIEKPLVVKTATGRDLIDAADAEDVTLQVGHIERFNPVTEVLDEILADIDVISVSAKRLGPSVDRTVEDSAVTDLMIHDIDLICHLLPSAVSDIQVSGAAQGRYATATLEFASGVIGSLTASRVTEKKIRQFKITADSCYVTADFIDQSLEVHRQSVPEYVATDNEVRYRHESIVEKPAVRTGEPLKRELESFLDAVQTNSQPRVTGEDGIQAVELAQTIDRKAFDTGSSEGEFTTNAQTD
ncbi:Gfo/Idh/MocA family protein [Haloarcula amylolytica]|uniref:Oxidoreductase domain-containing protein n=1 Tax=Haloarcula amylolytica JCM 13557 TaxID=1227452 RepID=M0KEC1_9EURY|nr:Gfo/Idh/MocA family oxidoreductase [Haloarcula amylolytica]EMA19531.1 oxidoreductase domain-containing protein [Haloarcula amylolytica JCM 13557]